ncbi:hypothetical protein B0T26DRAFT_750783 [Lasiosphaeria miniovina]|uniref:Fungal N-terminal domain-containing protein n=1 Tax=Lasiosphaeria miniovina TaxID=1954250 RepID=A0AA40AWY6_9PEZI|nr:uncharacterized protein B0T26DRAFT_750783 [Lasiosphaeria miniovina]KAK0723518.1 hypothetical protein B0T26DRAFT_750783 [Lasiosphaeria miniovina]
MDPLSISTACLALLGGIGKTAFIVIDFVRGYRTARSDLTALTGELTQLQPVLELIKDDTASQVLDITKNCFSVMEKVDTVLENHKGTLGSAKLVVLDSVVSILELMDKVMRLRAIIGDKDIPSASRG